MLKLIVCTGKDGGIGLNNKLPWNIKQEMQHFKDATSNHVIVMGRKTYDSIGRLLPNRDNIIFSNNQDLKIDGALVTNNIEDIICMSKARDVFIIGGKSIYDIFINHCDQLIISKLNNSYDCDVFVKFNLKFFELTNSIINDDFIIEYYQSIKHKILFGTLASEHIKNDLISKKNNLISKYKKIPKLVILQVGEEFASNVYIRNKIKLGHEIGIDVKHIRLGNCTQEKLLEEIKHFNVDDNTHGILVQLPLPKNFDEYKISQAIVPIKDVDCFNPENIGQLWINPFAKHVHNIPCTPYGIIKLLEFYKIDISGKKVVIVGRSNIVGKPLLSLFLHMNATVKICHSKTKNLSTECIQADILVTAIGQPKMINSKYIKEDAIVIDVGINRNSKNELCGDVDFDDVIKKVKLISPVPFGIGPMTLIMLFNNLLNAYIKLQEMI